MFKFRFTCSRTDNYQRPKELSTRWTGFFELHFVTFQSDGHSLLEFRRWKSMSYSSFVYNLCKQQLHICVSKLVDYVATTLSVLLITWEVLELIAAWEKFLKVIGYYYHLKQVSESHVRRYMDGSLKIKPEERRWNNVRESEIDLSDDNVAIVGLELIIDLPKQPSIGHFALRVVSCTALVGDIYRSVSHSNLTIVDQRSPKAIATIRTPSHLLHSASKLIQQ